MTPPAGSASTKGGSAGSFILSSPSLFKSLFNGTEGRTSTVYRIRSDAERVGHMNGRGDGMLNLHVIVASTRAGRQGPRVSAWFLEQARAHQGVERHRDMMPMLEAVAIPFFMQHVDEERGAR